MRVGRVDRWLSMGGEDEGVAWASRCRAEHFSSHLPLPLTIEHYAAPLQVQINLVMRGI